MSNQNFVPQEQPERKVTVNSTSGACEVSFMTKATTYGELKKDFVKNKVSWEGMKVIIGDNFQELEHDSDILLQKEMEIFLTPMKVRSGN